MSLRRIGALILSTWVMIFSGCYRMPTENDFSVVPTTNNPAVTYEKNDNLLPGMKY